MHIPNGYHELPPGKIAAIVTYLEMTEQPKIDPPAPPPGVVLRRVVQPGLAWYRRLFRAVGQDWLWFSRLVMPDEELNAIIGSEQVLVHVLERDGQEIGLMELDLRDEGEVQIMFFGLTPDAIGKGAGWYLIHQAIRTAWTFAPRRVWLHTCTSDSPQALGFYMAAGFRPYKRCVEVADDPRLNGKLPREAGPRLPIIE